MNDSTLLLDIWKAVHRQGQDIASLKASIQEVVHWGRRVAILVALWTAGIAGNLSNQHLADITALIVKRLIAE